MADWFTENAPVKSTANGDWFAQNQPSTDSNTTQPGYLGKVRDRATNIIVGFYDSWKKGDLEEMSGLAGLENQYKNLHDRGAQLIDQNGSIPFRELPGIILEAVPFIGPSIMEMTDALAKDDYSTAGAIFTTDIAPALITKKAVEKVPGAARILRESAEKNYRKILEPTSDRQVVAAERLAPQLAEERIVSRSRTALQESAKSKMAEVGPKAGSAFEGGQPLDWAELNNKLEGVREKHVYVKGTDKVPSNRQPLSKLIDDIQNDLFDLADDGGGVPQQVLDNFIDDLNKGLVNTRGEYPMQLAPKSKRKIEQSSARALREYLDSKNPTGAGVNAVYSMYARLNEFLESSRRKRIKAESGITTGSSKGFGALVERTLPGPIRKVPRAIASVFDSVPWHTINGATKQTIADAIAVGDWNKVANILSVATAIQTSPTSRSITPNPFYQGNQ